MRAMCDNRSSFPMEVMSCVSSNCNVEEFRGSSSVL
jgi:hypothetical protein